MKKLIKVLVMLFSVGALGACENFLEVERPIDKQVSEYVFSSDETAEAAGLGMYGSVVKYGQGAFTGLFTVYLGIVADELYATGGYESALQLRENRLLPEHSGASSIWLTSYETIYHVNLFLEKINRSEQVSAGLRARLAGEARFLRALFYFYLVNTYGNIPLIDSPDYHKNGSLTQSGPEVVYPFILADLEAAYDVLTPDYLLSEPVRANKWAAAALLARVHLFLENWSDAEKFAREVVQKGSYALVPVDEVRLNSNAEAILQFAQSESGLNGNYEASMLLYQSSTSNRPDYAVEEGLLKAFSPEDARQNWLWEQVTTDSVTYYLAHKYKIRWLDRNVPRTELLTVLRLGEQHLILAEALAQQGELDAAVEQLDILRTRAGITLLDDMDTPKTKENVLDLVMDERQRELCFELGHRWFDLNRTGRADAYFSSLPYKDWQPTDRYFPIPQSEILLNPFLKQNPGYE